MTSQGAGAVGTRGALPRRRFLALAMAAGAGAAAGCARIGPGAGGNTVLKVVGTGLRWAGQPFEAAGANVWQLQDYFCPGAGSFVAGGTTWHPGDPGDPARGVRVLQGAAAYGLHVIRFIAGGWNPAWLHYWQTEPEKWWSAHDQMMAAAQQAGIHLIPSLVWHALPFAVATGEVHSAVFTPGTAAHALMLKFVQEYVGRYRHHPSVLMWELGNEWNLNTGRGPADTQYFSNTTQLAAAFGNLVGVIKAVDPEHLVTSGCASPPYGTGPGEAFSLNGQAEAFVAVNQHVDVACVHVYPDTDLLTAAKIGTYLATLAEAARNDLRKPLMVGEFGENYTQHPQATFVRNVLASWSAGTFPLALVWSWMAAPSSGTAQLDVSVDPTLRPEIADLFRTYAGKHPWPPGT